MSLPAEIRGSNIDAGDVLIVGAGLAGLFTALKLAPAKVLLLATAPLGTGASSAWAQGGIAAAVHEGDTPEAHAADTIAAGAGLVDQEVARVLANEAAERIEDLLRIGVPFDRDLEGRLAVGLEAAHSHKRIVHVKGDQAGKAVMAALVETATAAPSIDVLPGYSAYELVMESGRTVGVYARPVNGDGLPVLVTARSVVFALGGIGGLYEVTTNPPLARGEGIAMAARAGAVIGDPEFVQFHPTAIAGSGDPARLASEAIRGEGAVLVDETGTRFMEALHPSAELAPRDIVARAIADVIKGGGRAFLDTRQAIGTKFPDEFPTVYGYCRQAGIDPVQEPIPVAPAAHYHMGGIATDLHGRSSLPGLWACGEVACTGAHGANRLASNSLLEAVVFGARVAADIGGSLENLPHPGLQQGPTPVQGGDDARAAQVTAIRQVMAREVGVVRDEDSLKRALRTFARIESEAGEDPDLINMSVAARLIATAALVREESRGGHYRSDFPATDETRARRTMTTLSAADAVAEELLAEPAPARREACS